MSKQAVADVGGIPEYNSEVRQSRNISRPAGYGGEEWSSHLKEHGEQPLSAG